MNEILPGIFHWTVTHPRIKIEVSSYYLADSGIVIDPLIPQEQPDGRDWKVDHILLTNRHHYRDSGKLVEKHGCQVWCAANGLHEFTKGEKVTPFEFGDTLPGGVEAVEIGCICPDETALLIPGSGGVVALADGVMRQQDGPLSFVPDEYMGGDTAAVKDGLRRSYGQLLQRDFNHLLLAHGWPLIDTGKTALETFVQD